MNSSNPIFGADARTPYNRIMVDLETLGTRPGSVIVSVGAVFFSASEPKPLGEEFYTIINVPSQINLMMETDPEVMDWWTKQSPEVQKVLDDAVLPEAPSIKQVLARFSMWVKKFAASDKVQIWGNGANFDNVLLREAYNYADMDAPWNWYNDRCYRTLKNLPAAKGTTLQRLGMHHNALDDAKTQALHAVDIMQRMNAAHALQDLSDDRQDMGL